MKIFYDVKTDSLSISFKEKKKYHTSLEIAEGVVLDFDKKKNILAIEFMEASKKVDINSLLVQSPSGVNFDMGNIFPQLAKR